MSALSDLVQLLKQEKKTGTDYTGTVTRVEGRTAYVRITGSDIMDTPVTMSIDAKAGDTVRVRVANGRAWLSGNDSKPPTHNTEDIDSLTKRVTAVEKMQVAPRAVQVSHIGMIIHTTTLDTMDKVVSIYGGTAWIQHSGYMLRGASSGVTGNNASSDGGAETVTLTGAQSGIPAHNTTSSGTCSITSSGGHTHAVKIHNNNTTGGTGARIGASTDTSTVAAIANNTGAHTHTVPNHTHSISAQNASEAHNNMPPYKNVYIWERIA